MILEYIQIYKSRKTSVIQYKIVRQTKFTFYELTLFILVLSVLQFETISYDSLQYQNNLKKL